MTHLIHFIYGYMASDIMVANEQTLLSPISSKGSFIYIIPQDTTYLSLCYTNLFLEHWLDLEIAQWKLRLTLHLLGDLQGWRVVT